MQGDRSDSQPDRSPLGRRAPKIRRQHPAHGCGMGERPIGGAKPRVSSFDVRSSLRLALTLESRRGCALRLITRQEPPLCARTFDRRSIATSTRSRAWPPRLRLLVLRVRLRCWGRRTSGSTRDATRRLRPSGSASTRISCRRCTGSPSARSSQRSHWLGRSSRCSATARGVAPPRPLCVRHGRRLDRSSRDDNAAPLWWRSCGASSTSNRDGSRSSASGLWGISCCSWCSSAVRSRTMLD